MEEVTGEGRNLYAGLGLTKGACREDVNCRAREESWREDLIARE